METNKEIEVVIIEDNDTSKSHLDKAKDEVKKLMTNPSLTKTVEDVSDFTQSTLRKGSEFIKHNKTIQDTVEKIVESTDKTVNYVQQNEAIQNTIKTVKQTTLKGVHVVKDTVDTFVSKPEVASAIKKTRDVSADALESAGKTLADWIRPKEENKKEGD